MKSNIKIVRFILSILLISMLTACGSDMNSSSKDEDFSKNSSMIYESEGQSFEESSITEDSPSSTEDESFEYSEESSISEITSEETSNDSKEENDKSNEESKDISSHVSEEPPDISVESPSLDFPDDAVTIDSAGERFKDKFTSGEIISDETSYKSEYISVELREITYEGKLYFVQDIYIKNIESLSVGFAGLKFGKKYNDYVYNMVNDYRKSGVPIIGAINGDYCGLDGKGVIIRNGVLYGTGKAQYTICVLYKNGIMRTIPKNQFNAQAEIERGAWHAWDFGPSFVTAEGDPIETFTERTSIRGANPRSAIGYFEPGHYCFVTAGGRKGTSPYGVSFKQISRFMSSIGCKVGYNLDGGQSAVMVFNDSIVNEKYQQSGRRISDIIYVCDITNEP